MRNKMFYKIFVVILIILMQGFILYFRYEYLIYIGRDLISARLLILMYFISSLIVIKLICDRFMDFEGDNNEQCNTVDVKKID